MGLPQAGAFGLPQLPGAVPHQGAEARRHRPARRRVVRTRMTERIDRTERLLADSDYLTREIASLRLALGEVVTRDYLRGEIRDLLEEFKEIQSTDKKDDPKTS